MGRGRALVCLMMLLAAAGCAPAVTPLPRAHAHNDYQHARPLFDALAHGFCSIEVDIHLVDDRLLVGHDVDDVDPSRTLRSLYLDPLREHIRRNGGCVFPADPGQPLTLLIDIKSEGGPTYHVLRDELLRYREILTMYFADGTTHPRAVNVVLTGRVPRAWVAREALRFVACDGVLADLASVPPPPVDLVPQVNARWTALFSWRGNGGIPDDERRELRRLAGRAQEQDRRIRFWSAPDNEVAWAVLADVGVDLINSDDLPGLRRFLLSRPDVRAATGK